MSAQSGKGKAYDIAFMGLMLALALALSFLESMLPVLPFLPVGVKLGLSNIVVMYCLFFGGAKESISVCFLKSAFVMLMRGPVGGALSFAGGLLSVAIMALLKRVLGLSNGILSIFGAVSHNIGQLVLASVILKSVYTFYYLPVMIVSGAVMGVITGVLLKLVMPYLQHVDKTAK